MNLLIPSLKITGGNIEAIKLIDSINTFSHEQRNIYALWDCSNPLKVSSDRVNILSINKANKFLAPFEILYLLIKFYFIDRVARERWLFTHYSTLPFAFLVKRDKRFFFVQDLEWKFIKNSFLQLLLKKFILNVYSKGNVLAANRYLQDALLEYGLKVKSNVSIWADAKFLCEKVTKRNIDVVMILRNGHYKRLDLYKKFISKCRLSNDKTIAVITPEKKIFSEIKDFVDYCLYSPSIEEMRQIYTQSKIFLHLSDHEGFGLPPLEAMGSGCVPLCRDSGGVRAYMEGLRSEGLLLPDYYDLDQIYSVFEKLLENPDRLNRLSEDAIVEFKSGLRVGSNFALKNDMF